MEIVCDRGREFMGAVQNMLRDDYHIKKKMITTRNPQANSIVERAHKTLNYHMGSLRAHAKQDIVEQFRVGVLTNLTRAMNSTIHTTLDATPTQLVFGRDAFLPVSFKASWDYIGLRKRRLIDQNNKQENATRLPHTYHVDDLVLVLDMPNRKYGNDKSQGPFKITQVNENGTVCVRVPTRSGAVITTWNVRNVRPYSKPDPLP